MGWGDEKLVIIEVDRISRVENSHFVFCITGQEVVVDIYNFFLYLIFSAVSKVLT